MNKNKIKFRNCTGIECPLFSISHPVRKGRCPDMCFIYFYFCFYFMFCFCCGVLSGPDFKREFRHAQSRKALFQMRIILSFFSSFHLFLLLLLLHVLLLLWCNVGPRLQVGVQTCAKQVLFFSSLVLLKCAITF